MVKKEESEDKMQENSHVTGLPQGKIELNKSEKNSCFSNVFKFIKFWMLPPRLSYDEKVSRISFFVIILVFVTLGSCAMFGRTMELITNLDAIDPNKLWIEIADRCVMAAVLILLPVFTITFILIHQRFFQVLLFLVNSCFFFSQIFSHFVYARSAGLLEGSPIIVTIGFVIGMSLFFGNKWNIIIWSFGIALFMLSGFIIDVLTTDLVTHFADKKEIIDRLPAFALPYFMIFSNVVILLVIILFLKRKIYKNNFLMNQIGKSILDLSFDTKPMQKLIKKKTVNCSTSEIMFKSIINNIKEYIQFLPDSLKYAEEADQITTSTQGGKENISDAASVSSSSVISRSSIASYGEETLAKQSKKINFGLNQKSNVVLLKVSTFVDQKNDIQAFEKKFVQFNDVVCDCVYSKRGTISQMVDLDIVATFNSERTLVTSSLNAVDCAKMIEEKLALIGMKCVILVLKVDNMICGTVKSKFNSKFQHFSPKYKLLNCLEHREKYSLHSNIDLSASGNIFVNSPVQNETKYEFLFKQVNEVKYFDYLKKEEKEEKEIFFRVVMKKNTDSKHNSEWMYKISSDLEERVKNENGNSEEEEITEKVKQFNDIWSKYDLGDFESCKKMLEDYIKLSPKEDVDAVCLKGKLGRKEM